MAKIKHNDGLPVKQAIALRCLAVLSYLEDGGSIFLQNAGTSLSVHTASSSQMSPLSIGTAVKTSNFASLKSRLFQSNAKSNEDIRPKILTTKCPGFSLETNQGHPTFCYPVNKIV
jgi:hypothetical protein